MAVISLFHEGLFYESLHLWSFAKIKPLQNFPNLQYLLEHMHFSYTPDKYIWDFSLGQKFFLIHVIFPRLSQVEEDCSLIVLDLMQMVVKWCRC